MRHAAAAALAVILALAAPARAHAGDATAILPLIGDDVDLVVAIDVAGARGSAPLTALLASGLARLPGGARGLSAMGIDSLDDLDTIVLGGRTSDDVFLVVLEGRAVDAALALAGRELTKKTHKKVAYWTDGDLEVTSLDKRLVMGSRGEVKRAIERSKDKKKARSLTRSAKAAAIRDAVALADKRAQIWLAGRFDAGGMGTDGLAISLRGAKDVSIQVRFRAPDEASAAAKLAEIQQQLGDLRQGLGMVGLSALGKTLRVSADGRVLELAATATQAELEQIVALAEMMK